MRAMIFAAGLGTRFKPWTDSNPKALAIINGKSYIL
jgi:NDP-sugar pyrophosphorylase family protein